MVVFLDDISRQNFDKISSDLVLPRGVCVFLQHCSETVEKMVEKTIEKMVEKMVEETVEKTVEAPLPATLYRYPAIFACVGCERREYRRFRINQCPQSLSFWRAARVNERKNERKNARTADSNGKQ